MNLSYQKLYLVGLHKLHNHMYLTLSAVFNSVVNKILTLAPEPTQENLFQNKFVI